jgi:hypothetical protein
MTTTQGSAFEAEILVIVPMKVGIHPELYAKAWALVQRVPPANPRMQFCIVVDTIKCPSSDQDSTPWSKVARVRNRIVREHRLELFTHVLWIDADVVEYDASLPTRLLMGNPEGVAAPMVLIEGTDQFYDTSAFVLKDKGDVDPENRFAQAGRQLGASPPYWPEVPADDIVEVDCVGTFYLVHTDVYRTGVLHEDHPSFTDHWSICRRARQLGRKVTVDRRLAVQHADLPAYGEAWH